MKKYVHIILGLSILGCNRAPSSTVKDKPVQIDSSAVLRESARYIFNEHAFAPSYYRMPIKVIDNGIVNNPTPFKINGKEVVFVDETALTDEIIAQVMEPEPFIEIRKFVTQKDGTIHINIYLGTIKQEYKLQVTNQGDACYVVKELGVIEY